MFTSNRILMQSKWDSTEIVLSKKHVVSLYPSTLDMHDISFVKHKSWCDIIQHLVPATMQLLDAIPARY